MTETFVTPEWILERRDEIVIVDVRDDWKYRDGHIPGSVSIPFDDFRSPSDETQGKLPTSDDFATLLEDAGITPDDHVAAYDDEFGVYASRFLVTAEIFGHDFDRLHLLDGDVRRWKHNHSLSTNTPTPEKTTYSATRTSNGPLVSAEQLEKDIDTDAIIVDTRTPLEYETVHLPGAINFQWDALVDDDQRRLKSLDRCRQILRNHDITLDRPVRLYCNTARRLSFVYTVLRELGHEDIGFYEGGIDSWAKSGRKVETTT